MIHNCFSFTSVNWAIWGLVIGLDWGPSPAQYACNHLFLSSSCILLSMDAGYRSWGVLFCFLWEAFCVWMMYSVEEAKPPAAHLQPQGNFIPPPDLRLLLLYLVTHTSAYGCSPSQFHKHEDTGRLTAVLQWWQITQALPETLRQ